MSSLTLIGVHHGDYRGKERLDLLLQELQPDLITLETCEKKEVLMSQLREEYEREVFAALVARGFPEELLPRIHRFVESCTPHFEYPAVAEYCQAQGIPFFLIDHPSKSVDRAKAQGPLEAVKSSLLEKDYATLIQQVQSHELEVFISSRGEEIIDKLNQPVEEHYAAAHFALGKSDKARALALEFCDELSPYLKYRDAYMARRLRKLWEENPSADFVYVGGWGHLLDDPLRRTLY